jgi:type II secretory ATPase GspE/PulE/Tfp pilus assembly ATPase PilB-like protein
MGTKPLPMEEIRLKIPNSIRLDFSLQLLILQSPLLGFSLFYLFAFPRLVFAAEGGFPRGEGFYYSLPKIVTLVALYLCWVRTSSWVDQDARQQHFSTVPWNPLMLGCGVVGMIVVWLLPLFWVSFLLLLILYLSSSLAYATYRNQRVPEDERVLSETHFKKLAARFLHINRKIRKAKSDEGPPIRFIGRSISQREEDPARVTRATECKGYKAAAEMIVEAVKLRATNIQLEPNRDEVAVRYRIDGIFQPAKSFSRSRGEAVINVFKVLANLDSSEKRKPQDGSVSAKVDKRTVDFRISTSGSVVGEKMVLRIHDKTQRIIDLAKLGMTETIHRKIRALIAQPNGMLIVTGPSGAGKSTTLDACLYAIDRFTRNVIAVESPVEFRVENVAHFEIDPKAGQRFATELPRIVRQDPDVILIGEIPDATTAEIACQAVQNGKVVFSSVEAPDAVAALLGIIELGLEPAWISGSVRAVLAQRLVRLLCSKCKVRYKPNAEMLRKANLPADIKYFYRPPEPGERPPADRDEGEGPKICKHCRGTGYRGQTGIFELLEITDPIRELISHDPNANAIQQEAIRSGMRHLQEDGLRQVIEGNTSIQELVRVCK